ncbi:hypothetical protein ACS127_17765 [Amphibacillus sp. Q70]|uniref:hypothetical protein n=1 Tax=Amphibacillus sp. Q70 TaxID=3453416 RepID=UPI003F86DA9A
MDTIIYGLLTIGYLLLLIWGLKLGQNHRLFEPSNLLLLVIIGLIYDNAIIGLGRFIGEGQTLANLTYLRYWLHALFTPTLVLFAWQICIKLGLPWAKNRIAKGLIFLITLGLIFYEWFSSIRDLVLEPTWKNGILTYESVVQQKFPLMVIITTVIVGIIGAILLKKFRFYWLLVGTIIMIVGSILAIWIKNFPIMNGLEFLFIFTLLKTKQFQIEKLNRKYHVNA